MTFRSIVFAVPILTALAVASPAQSGYRWESVPSLGIKFKIPEKLQSIPLKLGGDRGNLVAKYEPDRNGWIYGKYGRYSWEIEIYDFTGLGATKKPETGSPKTREEAEAQARAKVAATQIATSFDDWVRNKDRRMKKGRTFLIEGQRTRARGKALDYKNWEYQDYQTQNIGGRSDELVWHQFAAVVDLDGKELAVVINMPGDEKGKVARRGGVKSKYVAIAKSVLSSITPLSDKELAAEDEGDEKKDEHAKTPEQQKALEQARANIAGKEGWDYFTSPNYICLWSYPPGKTEKQREVRKFAKKLIDGVEGIREEYRRFFPPHEDMGEPYSVIRICEDYTEFRQYGDVSGGVVGFFSPASKELVMFYDYLNQFGGEDYVIQVAYHEAWHQFSDAYFGRTELHRWFDEGLGDFFGGFERTGRRWKYTYDKGRFGSIRAQVARETYIPTAEIVTWNKDKFYGGRAPDHYAQGYSIVDFLFRGKRKTGRRWDDRWEEILPIYVKTALETKSQKKAVEAAFEGVDFEAFDQAWLDWIRKGMKADKTQPKPMKGLVQ